MPELDAKSELKIRTRGCVIVEDEGTLFSGEAAAFETHIDVALLEHLVQECVEGSGGEVWSPAACQWAGGHAELPAEGSGPSGWRLRRLAGASVAGARFHPVLQVLEDAREPGNHRRVTPEGVRADGCVHFLHLQWALRWPPLFGPRLGRCVAAKGVALPAPARAQGRRQREELLHCPHHCPPPLLVHLPSEAPAVARPLRAEQPADFLEAPQPPGPTRHCTAHVGGSVADDVEKASNVQRRSEANLQGVVWAARFGRRRRWRRCKVSLGRAWAGD
eukprot:10671303-Alexandrium_andersonii.AAC.1